MLLTLSLGACTFDMFSPGATEQDLDFQLDAPEEVAQHEPFEVQLTVTNRSGKDMRVMTPHSCLVEIGLFADEERVPFKGSHRGCHAAITHHEIPAGESPARTFDMRAEKASSEEPIPSGTYVIRAVPEVREINDEAVELPAVERELVVR